MAKQTKLAKAVKTDKKLQKAMIALCNAAVTFEEAKTILSHCATMWNLRTAANQFTNRLRIFYRKQAKKNGKTISGTNG